MAHKPGEVIFNNGQLVQIYRSDLDFTLKTDRKLLPKWSPPQRVTSRNLNSYILEKLDGTPIAGQFRRLRGFIPKEGTNLAMEQAEIDERRVENEPVGTKDTREEGLDDETPENEPQAKEDLDECDEGVEREGHGLE